MSDLPEAPSLEWLRKEAKRVLADLRKANPFAKLADAQFNLAKRYAFPSWRALKEHIDGLSVDNRLQTAAKTGDTAALAALLDANPEKLHVRLPPYGSTLLHAAASEGRLAVIELLLARGLDANAREEGDNTYPLHWAAAAGAVQGVRRLIEAGADVIGHGDDHELEVIGWATCWEGCDDEAHRAVANLLVAHGARHHIFSAVAMRLSDEVRRIVAADPSALSRRMSRNENHQTPLHFAVRMNRPTMVELLLELGADPLAVDGAGNTAALYASSPDVDRAVMHRIRALTVAEVDSARRGKRPVRATAMDLVAAVSLRDWEMAEQLLRADSSLIAPSGGALHLMAKRNDAEGVRWLLAHGADPSARWAHWDSDVTPLHLAVLGDHAEIVKILLRSGADPRIKDTKHDSDALEWAQFFRRSDLVTLLEQKRG